MANPVVTNTSPELDGKTLQLEQTIGAWQPPSIVTLTNAEIKALPTVPKVLIAQPAAGYFIRVHGVSLAFNFVTAYTNISLIGTGTYFAISYGDDGAWVAPVLINDGNVGVTRFSDYFGAIQSKYLLLPGGQFEITDGPWTQGYAAGSVTSTPRDTLNATLKNGALGNLLTGNALNTLKITTYYSLEAL